MKLIPDWQLAWRFLSVQAAMLLALLSGLQAEVLPLFFPLFPEHVWPWVSGGLALAVVVLRLVAQDGLQIEREQLALASAVEADAAEASASPSMPAGRLERYLGLAFVGALLVVIAIMGVALWALWKAGAA